MKLFEPPSSTKMISMVDFAHEMTACKKTKFFPLSVNFTDSTVASDATQFVKEVDESHAEQAGEPKFRKILRDNIAQWSIEPTPDVRGERAILLSWCMATLQAYQEII